MYGSHLLCYLILAQLLATVLPADYHEMYKRHSEGEQVERDNFPGQIPPPGGFDNPNQEDYHHMNKRSGPGHANPPASAPNTPNQGGQGGAGGQNTGTSRTGIAGLPDPGQTLDTRGTEFIFGFSSNVGNAPPKALKIMIGAGGPANTSVIVSVPSYKFSKQLSIPFGETAVVDIPPAVAAIGQGPQNGTVWVRATRPVSVHGINIQDKSHDGFLAIPVFGLGLEYYAMSYKAKGQERSQMLITAVQDNTKIQVTPITKMFFNGRWFNKQDIISVTINRMQAIQIQTPGDLTGTRVLADRPISVMTGATCSLVPSNLNRCDHLVENIPPVATWGRHFSIVPLRNRTTGHVIRIMAARKYTKFTTLGQVFKLTKGGLFREINQPVTFPMSIVSDKPLLVVQFAKGGAVDKTGDPFMTVIPPVEQYVAGAVTFSTFSQSGTDRFRSFASISVTSWDLFNIYYNNKPLLSHSYDDPDRVDFMRMLTFDADYTMQLPPGANTIASPAPGSRFTANIYGFADGTSYGFPAVYGLRRLLCTSANTVEGKGIEKETDCTGPIVSGIVLSDTHKTGLGIQPPPKAPPVPGQEAPPQRPGGNNQAPGWGNFNPNKPGTDGEVLLGGGDAGVFFPWYTIPPWQAEVWEDVLEDLELECYSIGIITLAVFASSGVIFAVMLFILCALVFRKPANSKF